MQGNAAIGTGILKMFPGSAFLLGQVIANTIKIGFSELR